MRVYMCYVYIYIEEEKETMMEVVKAMRGILFTASPQQEGNIDNRVKAPHRIKAPTNAEGKALLQTRSSYNFEAHVPAFWAATPLRAEDSYAP